MTPASNTARGLAPCTPSCPYVHTLNHSHLTCSTCTLRTINKRSLIRIISAFQHNRADNGSENDSLYPRPLFKIHNPCLDHRVPNTCAFLLVS